MCWASGAKKVFGGALLVAPAVARRQLSIRLKLSAIFFLKIETFLKLSKISLGGVWNTTAGPKKKRSLLRKDPCGCLTFLTSKAIAQKAGATARLSIRRYIQITNT